MRTRRPYHPARTRSGKRGVTLIMVAGVLAILAALGGGFYSVMFMQSKSAVRYSDAVRAEMMARAGIEDAVAKLRALAIIKPEDPNDPWYGVDYLNGAKRQVSFCPDLSGNKLDDDGDGIIDSDGERVMAYSRAIGSSAGNGSDRYILNVSDAASRINVNACDNLAVVLDNLCRAIGAPMVAADLDHLQPARWAKEGADAALYGKNTNDIATKKDLYYTLDKELPVLHPDGSGRALYGDGYAIAGYRARNGKFKTINDVKNALTVVEKPGRRDLEQLEREVKFAALKEYITVDSWVDANTVCVGKFEWIDYDIAIDRDKSWIPSVTDGGTPIPDPKNERGSLKGCYVSIMNGHGAGQLRLIKENGIDWVKLETPAGEPAFVVEPGPISSYMIIAKEDAITEPVKTLTGTINLPKQNADGTLVDDPKIDYSRYPLCTHRSPININTASDKVLVALFLGLNVQHGHPMAVGTGVDLVKLAASWRTEDPKAQEPYLLTIAGLKRIPLEAGKPTLDRKLADVCVKLGLNPKDVAYLNNYGTLAAPNYVEAGGDMTEAHELALRVLAARQRKMDLATRKFVTPDVDPSTKMDRGPFRSWDDFYFRVVKPWDEERVEGSKAADGYHRASAGRLVMAAFNSNTALLKFNPNIEWIDRWGRNFTEMEPVMVYDLSKGKPIWIGQTDSDVAVGEGLYMWSSVDYDANNAAFGSAVARERKGAYYIRSLRYKTTEMIDKSDLNRSTTEFSFDSGGIYAITSIGQITKGSEVLAERRFDALVKVYDVWRETTQRQFVQGKFESPGGMGDPGTPNSGQVSRDAYNQKARLPLTTLPEPLVPLSYVINNPNGITDICDGDAKDGRDAFGNPKTPNTPDVVANRILPAQYDGQIVLATNTSNFQADDTTFLASFNGDLDTDTSRGNGREQSKVPNNKAVRVVDTTGLLGMLNDNQIDFDPKSEDPGAAKKIPDGAYDVFSTNGGNTVYRRLDEKSYWENVTCRMGDLRTDGVFLGNVGVSGKDATVKYLMANNYDPGNTRGATVSMWYKPTWTATDYREHEFFNATNPGSGFGARYNIITKYGRYSWCLMSGNDGNGSGGPHVSCNDLSCSTEDRGDADWKTYLHGGLRGVPGTQALRESPSFHVQPFRWGFVGGKFNYNAPAFNAGPEYSGYWENEGGGGIASRDAVIGKDPSAKPAIRPFVDTARQPEGSKTWGPDYFWKQTNSGDFNPPDLGKQEAGWSWYDGKSNTGVFGINNLNSAQRSWLYRSQPIDGTQAVIDELRLANSAWDVDIVDREQTLSRYFLPAEPSDKLKCPVFISQTLLQSMKGFDKTKSDELVTVARVTWTVFTPRFMHENKDFDNGRERYEIKKGKKEKMKYRGPFNYIAYNRKLMLSPPKPQIGTEGSLPENDPVNNAELKWLDVDRPSPVDYKEHGGPLPAPKMPYSHALRGVEVELIDSPGYADNGAPALAGKTFRDPENDTRVSTDAPIQVKSSGLRYRVRFRYWIDQLVDKGGGLQVNDGNPNKHYLLDTPVFDDISITYFGQVRYLAYSQVSE